MPILPVVGAFTVLVVWIARRFGGGRRAAGGEPPVAPGVADG
jgi:hypothetical protein